MYPLKAGKVRLPRLKVTVDGNPVDPPTPAQSPLPTTPAVGRLSGSGRPSEEVGRRSTATEGGRTSLGDAAKTALVGREVVVSGQTEDQGIGLFVIPGLIPAWEEQQETMAEEL